MMNSSHENKKEERYICHLFIISNNKRQRQRNKGHKHSEIHAQNTLRNSEHTQKFRPYQEKFSRTSIRR